MNLPQSIDKTTTSQKVIAGVMIAAVIGFLNWVAPILENAVYAMIWAGLLAAGYIFHKPIWNAMKDASYWMTNKLIKLNPIAYLERCYDYMLYEQQQISKAINKVSSVRMTEKGVIEDKQKMLEQNRKKAQMLFEKGDQTNASVFSTKVSVDESMLKVRIPKYNQLREQEKELQIIYEGLSANLETLKYRKEALVDQYQASKQIDEASGLMDQFLSGNSENAKMYKQAEKETVEQTNLFIANYESFSRKMKPISAASSAEQAVNEAEGIQLIQEWNKVGKIQLPEMVS